MTNAVKSFACGGLSSLLFFNFTMFPLIFPVFQFQEVSFTAIYSINDSIDYLYATVTNAAKSFACGELSSLLFFNLILFPLMSPVFQFH